MKQKTYYVGLLADGKTAVFQYRENLDCLSCEILRYYGARETTKVAVRARLRTHKAEVLKQLEAEYPDRGFVRVRVD